ncbi:hypothetical protein LguiB_029025 [Lonicera macranthoides]
MVDLKKRINNRGRNSLVVFVFLVIVFDLLVQLVKGSVVFEVEHKFKGIGKRSSLSALRAHDTHRHARILSAVDLPLGGNGRPSDAALYFTKIEIGTPPKDYHVQVDTGSDLLWVNCAGCDKCPKKSGLGIELALYDPKGSTSGRLVTCDQNFCTGAFNLPTSDCKAGMLCQYSVTYGDGSSTTGYFVRDYLQLNRVSGNLQTTSMNGSVAFGCGAQQSGELISSSPDALDGIIGFGQANSSMLSQLAAAGKVKKMFSHCLEGTSGGGIFAIGQLVQPKLKSTPLVPNEQHYNVIMKAIEVGGDVLDLATDVFDTGARRGTIIDSGTTLAYLPDEVFNPLMDKIMARQPALKTHIVDQQFKCFYFTGNVDNGFPVVTFHFENSLSLAVHAHEYLFSVNSDDTEWCIGWQNSGLQSKDGKEITLLGDIVLSNKLVLYDLENQTMGWTEFNCSSSIKVRDEESGEVYTVGAHDLSLASTLVSPMISTFLLLLTVTLNILVQ